MAITKIKVNTGTLSKDIQSMETYLKNINQLLEKMGNEVRELDSMWDGPANEAFNKAFLDDVQSLSEVCDGVQSIIDYESNARKEYDSCESKVSGLVDSISV